MFYTPVLKYEKATKIVEEMRNSDDERDKLIVYYIDYWKYQYDTSRIQISEYQEIFDKMSKFITGRPPTIYG